MIWDLADYVGEVEFIYA